MITAMDGGRLPSSYREGLRCANWQSQRRVLVFFFSSQVAFADDSACNAMATLAKSVMESRQSGMPMTKAIGLINSENKEVANLTRKLVIAAYEEPAWNSKALQEKATNDFQNRIYLPCIKGS
ncbi:hypothetical protein K2E96_01920 [Pseudomonas sp. ERGC3:05]|nr:hypothetical protein [Pseudomonas sp. ERGC3:01]QZC95093.1 hypothetical protein K2E96_01920 [Pseudomonas sp. ERGC3:05]